EADVGPPGLAVAVAVEHVAPVDDQLVGDQLTDVRRVELAELGPLGQVKHRLGALDRLGGRLGIPQRGEDLGGVGHRLRVEDVDLGPGQVQLAGDGQCGGGAEVVRVRLAGGAQHGDPAASAGPQVPS